MACATAFVRPSAVRALLDASSGMPHLSSLSELDYFPMQKVEKMRFRMSSAVVAPVMASMGRRAA